MSLTGYVASNNVINWGEACVQMQYVLLTLADYKRSKEALTSSYAVSRDNVIN